MMHQSEAAAARLPGFMNNETARRAVRLVCLGLILLMLIVALTVYRADWQGLLIFIAFIVFYVQLPGQLLVRVLGIEPKFFSTLLSTGFFVGWAIITLQYFVTELLPTNLLLYAAGPICTVIYLILIWRSRQNRHSLQQKADLSPAFCIFVVLALLYSMLLTQYLYLSPTVDQTITMNPDKGFHLGLINSLSHGYPLECPWFAGLYYNYHIFTELLYSVPVRLFGMTADTLLFTCGPWLTVYAFGMSMYSLFQEMCAKPGRAGIYCLALMLSNLFIARGIDRSIAVLVVFRNENVAAYGVSCTITLFVLLRYWYTAQEKGGFAWRKLIPCIALLMLVTGIKGPFALVTVAALWGTWALGLLLRKAPVRLILPMLLMTICFYLVYTTVLGSKGQHASAGESIIAMANILNITFYKGPLVALMKSMGIPMILRYAVLLGVFTVCLLTAFFLPFVIGYIRELVLVLTGRREFDFTRVMVYAAVLVGFIAMLLLNYHGHSQIYFGFVTVFFAPLIAFWFFEDMEDNHSVWMKALRAIFIVCLVLCAAGMVSFMIGQSSEASEAADPDDKGGKYTSMSQKDYEAMRWIDENTPKDSLLATDRYYSVSPKKFDVTDRWDNRFFLYADYSNRICYLAGAGYNLPAREWQKRQERIEINDRFFDADDPGRGELARDLGIDYVVVSKRFTHAGDLSNDDYHLCFSNDDVDVYEITN